MGTGYSLPRTPEDFLSNVDEMDSSETGKDAEFHMNYLKFDLLLRYAFVVSDKFGLKKFIALLLNICFSGHSRSFMQALTFTLIFII